MYVAFAMQALSQLQGLAEPHLELTLRATGPRTVSLRGPVCASKLGYGTADVSDAG